MTGESFYNDPGSLQSDEGVTLQWESICIVTPADNQEAIKALHYRSFVWRIHW